MTPECLQCYLMGCLTMFFIMCIFWYFYAFYKKEIQMFEGNE